MVDSDAQIMCSSHVTCHRPDELEFYYGPQHKSILLYTLTMSGSVDSWKMLKLEDDLDNLNLKFFIK